MALVTKERTTYGRTAAARYETHGGHGRRHQRNEPRRPCTRFRLAARAAITALVVAIVSAAIGTSSAVANGVPFAKGDVLAGIGLGNIKHFDSSGKLLDTLGTTSGSSEEAGMCFDSAGNLYSTNFEANTMSKFDGSGNLLLASFGSGFNASPESCVFDGASNMYVGQAEGLKQVLKFNTSGESLGSFSPLTEP